MFDTIVCEYPLPDGKKFESFQTKSLECLMGTYKITADGELFGTRGWMFEVAEGEQDERQLHYTGAINFYTSDTDGTWCEYIALFLEGKLLSLTVAEDKYIHPERQEILKAIEEVKKEHS